MSNDIPYFGGGPQFAFPEDYTLFGLLVLHGLCTPGDLDALILTQRNEASPRPLLVILAEHNDLPPAKQNEIADLLKLLSTPKLRASFPQDLPAVATIREAAMATIRESATPRIAFPPAKPSAPPLGEAPTVVNDQHIGTAPTQVSGGSVSSASIPATMSTRLTIDEMNRIERSRNKGRLVGATLYGHIVLDRLGGGGQGDVYLAKQLSLNRYVALKSLEIPRGASIDHFLSFFRKEAETLGRINHTRIVKVFEIFENEGAAYFTMEYIPGKTLRDLVKEAGQPIPLDVVANIACQACSALQRTSEDGLVHRDIKPHNMLLDENGDLKIVDFGLAGAAASFGEGSQFAGTPAYASPEQAENGVLTAASDQYSLGLTLYYALTAVDAVSGKTVSDMLFKQVNDTPPPPSERNNALPKAVDRVIMRMLEKDPKKRFASFDECFTAWAEVLQSYATGSTGAPATQQLLGETLLRISKNERVEVVKSASLLGAMCVALAAGAALSEGALRSTGMAGVLKFCGDWGTALLAFSLACIGYVAAARVKWVPMLGSFRVWLYTHIATAIPAILMLLVHSGHYLRGLLPGGEAPKNMMSVVVALSLTITAISGAVGLVLFRALQRQLQIAQLNLRGQRPGEREQMMTMLTAKALSGWRLVHYPLAVLFVVLSILHIVAAIKFGY